MRAQKLFSILIGLTFCLQACGSSSGAPPVSIPAPATANIRASSPDDDGLVTVSGGDGAVEVEATVQVTNTDATALRWEWFQMLLWRIAWAQTASTVTTTADANGAFSVQITADEDDTLEIVAIDPDRGYE